MDADLACKEANFPRGALAVLKNLNSNGFDFFMDEVECNGTETNLVRCKHKERSDCGSDQAAGAICDSATDDDLAADKENNDACDVICNPCRPSAKSSARAEREGVDNFIQSLRAFRRAGWGDVELR